MEHGDFTHLAENYAKYRPGYSPFVLDALLGLHSGDAGVPDCVDAGAGTGIWSRTMAMRGCRVVAVEPNDAMRENGMAQNGDLEIRWVAGSAEKTNLEAGCADIITMASSFHWPDFGEAVAEFDTLLRPGGLFMALWNTRMIELNPMLVHIENKLKELVPTLKRVSSGRSEFCDGLTPRLADCGVFDDVLYLEGRHVEHQSRERYLGLWESVNDVRVQAGEERFLQFMDFIREAIAGAETIEATYLTRAWIARKPTL